MRHRPIPKLTVKQELRFLESRAVARPDECWIWLEGQMHTYGIFSFNCFDFVASRVAYFVEYGIDPGDLLVCHKCNNGLCVNPNHLYLGTDSQNTQQIFDDGIKNHRGVNHPNVLLNERQIIEVRNSDLTQIELSRKYGVSKTTIFDIVRRRSWRHL